MSANYKNTSAYLELIIGPMFSGKTSKLMEIYKQCKFCNIDVAVINHSSDTRYHETMLSSHDKLMIPCHQTNLLMNIYDQISKAKVILINEGQFFPDLFESVKDLLAIDKQIYIAGLDGDFERNLFGQILLLVPVCDKVTKLTSLCGLCKNGTPGIFSLRITNEKQQFLIGSDNYVPACRNCYEHNV